MSEMALTHVNANPDEVAETSGFWFIEEVTPNLKMSMKLNRITFNDQSEFQTIQIAETEQFGKTLVLDSKTQSALFDEYVYHECLVHPAMLLNPNPKTVYIGGGGELATAREILRHKSVEKVVMVDIDQKVVEICRDELPEWNAGSTEDPRLELHYTDAYGFLEQYDGTFDVIIMDIADPIEAGPGIALYTKGFYELAIRKLNPNGCLVTQSGPGDIHNFDECFTAINKTLRSAFPHVAPYTASIPSFGTKWGFNVAFKEMGDGTTSQTLRTMDPDAVDAKIASRLSSNLRYLDGITHMGIFGVPKPIRLALEKEDRVITKENPVFMH